MKKISIEYILEDHFDELELECHLKSKELLRSLHEVDVLFRSVLKYGPEDDRLRELMTSDKSIIVNEFGENSSIQTETVRRLWVLFSDILEEQDVNLYRLVF